MKWIKAPCKGCGETIEDEVDDNDRGQTEADWWCWSCWPEEDRRRLKAQIREAHELIDEAGGIPNRDPKIGELTLAQRVEMITKDLGVFETAYERIKRERDAEKVRVTRYQEALERIRHDLYCNSRQDRRGLADPDCPCHECIARIALADPAPTLAASLKLKCGRCTMESSTNPGAWCGSWIEKAARDDNSSSQKERRMSEPISIIGGGSCERCGKERDYGRVIISAEFGQDHEEKWFRRIAKVCYPCGRAIIDEVARAHGSDSRSTVDIVRSLAVSVPDVTEGGETWCAVCDTELHLGWPSWSEHREDCAYKGAYDYCYGKKDSHE